MSRLHASLGQLELLKKTNALFLNELKEMMQNFGGVPESKISEAKIYALQTTGYNGVRFPKLEDISSDDTSENKLNLAEENIEDEILEEIEIEEVQSLQVLDEGYLLNKLFADLLQNGAKNKVEQALLDDAIAYLEPHEIEGAIREKKSVYQVRDTITNSIIRIQVMQIMRWEKIYRLQQKYGQGEHRAYVHADFDNLIDLKVDDMKISPEICLIKDKELYIKK